MSDSKNKDATTNAAKASREAADATLMTVYKAARKLGIRATEKHESNLPARVYYSSAKQMWVAEIFGLRFARPELCDVVHAAKANMMRTVEGLGSYHEGGLDQFLLDNPGVVTTVFLSLLDLETQHQAAHAATAQYQEDLAKGNLC